MQTELWDGTVIKAHEGMDGAAEVVMIAPAGINVRLIINGQIAYQAVAR